MLFTICSELLLTIKLKLMVHSWKSLISSGYLESYATDIGRCDKDTVVRLGNALGSFNRLYISQCPKSLVTNTKECFIQLMVKVLLHTSQQPGLQQNPTSST